MSSTTETTAAPTKGGGSSYGWRIVAALAITQTTGYGVLYYAFSVFLVPMARELRVSNTQITVALTMSVLIAALCAPMAGRWLDAHGGRGLMTAGSVLGTAAVLAWSQVTNLLQLYAIFAAIGIACSMVLYEAAFAVIIAWYDGNARGRANDILALTIVAGFASSIFIPLTGLLVDWYGWRYALVVLALMYGVAAIPLHALVIRRRPAAARTREAAEERADVLAATLAGLLGVLSVTGRLLTTGLQARLPAALIAAAIFALQGTAALRLHHAAAPARRPVRHRRLRHPVRPHRDLLRRRQGPCPARRGRLGPGHGLHLGDERGCRSLRDCRVGTGRLPSRII